MPKPLPAVLVEPATKVTLTLSSKKWRHESEGKEEISAFWHEAHSKNPALFNGHFFILETWRLSEGHLSGECCKTSYASYLHWREGGFIAPGRNAFAMPVVRSRDGAVLIGRMAAWTANAGTWYMPAGSIDAGDIAENGQIDLEGNMTRELGEEIGLEISREIMDKGWTLVFTRGRLAMFREICLAETRVQIEARIRDHLSQQDQAELDEIRFVTRLSDVDSLTTPPFLKPYLETLLPP